MAATHGQSPTDLKAALLSDGHRFTYVQAVRLLALLNEGPLRVRPELSRGFPSSDIAQVEERSGKKGFLMTATFLGLYGVSSPLPTFYTEDLFKDDSTATRDFLDIIHQRLYALLYEVWRKYRLFIQITENKNHTLSNMLYALCGLSGACLPGQESSGSYGLIRYAGLLGGHPRSTMGLATVLTDFLGGIPIDVIPFVARAVKIPPDQQWHLGAGPHQLGMDSFIGEEFVDRQGKFRVRLGPLGRERFRALLQEGEEHEPMVAMVNSYLTEPLDYDFELILKGTENKPACLGHSEWSRLGFDMTLYAGDFKEDMRVVFPPVQRQRRIAA